MSLNRITFRDQDETNLYTLPINPAIVDYVDDTDQSIIQTIDGTPIVIGSSYDGRLRKLEWETFPNDNANFSALKSELKTYRGQLKQINFQTIDHQSFGYKNVRIVSVSTVTPKGGALESRMILEYYYTESV